jgi:hypothetical protein
MAGRGKYPTTNIQHRTSSAQRVANNHWMLVVRCWMLVVFHLIAKLSDCRAESWAADDAVI